ncbi:MAG: ATP-binding cassette domain-containing protein [Arenicellales bacterium]
MTKSTRVDPLLLSGVTLNRGGTSVLESVSFTVREGEFIAVLGPNGAGKSTLFRAILGLLAPTRGSLEVFGEPPRRGSDLIGYLPQVRTDFTQIDVCAWDFVASTLRPSRWGLPLHGARARRDVEEAFAAVEAGDLTRRPLSALSGGERQRLLLAQALLGNPRLLLLDEPLISLDLRYQETVVNMIRRIQRERGITVLFTSHELNPLLDAIDRVLYLGNHQAAIGSIEEVITAPVLSRLYGLPIEVIRSNGRLFVVAAESGIPAEAGGHHHA